MDILPTVNPASQSQAAASLRSALANGGGDDGFQRGTRTQYHMSRSEVLRGVANRFVFSLAYIYLYLTMAALSLTTLALSLMNDCPTASFYLLETVVNLSLVMEVGIRWIAFGRQFWNSPYNIIDLFITSFCLLTLIFIFYSGCSAKGEEMFDTLLLIGRNLVQFFRLASVMRRSGKSIFRRPAPLDLSQAQDMRFSLDFDLDDEEALAAERRTLGGDRSFQSGGYGRSGGRGGKVRIEERRLVESDEESDD